MRYSKIFIGLLMNSLFSKLFFSETLLNSKYVSDVLLLNYTFHITKSIFQNWQTVVTSMRLNVAETIQICAIFKTQPWDIKMITLIDKTLSVVSRKFLRFLDDVISWLCEIIKSRGVVSLFSCMWLFLDRFFCFCVHNIIIPCT